MGQLFIFFLKHSIPFLSMTNGCISVVTPIFGIVHVMISTLLWAEMISQIKMDATQLSLMKSLAGSKVK